MLQNACFIAKIGADTDENEQHFAEILPTGAEGLRRGLALLRLAPLHSHVRIWIKSASERRSRLTEIAEAPLTSES